jgi:Mce-associated membrane protein
VTDTESYGAAVDGDAEELKPVVTNPRHWKHLVLYVLIPLLIMVGALGVGFLKWRSENTGVIPTSAAQSVVVATDTTKAMLSYQPASVEKDLRSASERMTGPFRDQYLALVNEAVIPGVKQRNIIAVATVRQAALISADSSHAQVLVYIDQSIGLDGGAPTPTISSARVGLDKVGGRWLVSDFQPI